jgi:hypothetical protein
MSAREEPLAGGIANAGKVVRVGDTVRRPAGPFTGSIFAALEHLERVGFDGAPRALGIDDRGREVLSFVEGDVPIPPYPAWSMTDEALASVARSLRRLHDAFAGVGDFDGRGRFDETRFGWSDDLADPATGGRLLHNDVCPENVVFRDGQAFAIIDWDLAAPGRALWDVAAVMAMWGPVREPSDPVAGMEGLDPFRRARVVADGYGLSAEARASIPGIFLDRLGISLVEKRAAAGEQAFIEMLERQGGPARRRRRREWLEANVERLRAALA